MAEDPVPPTTLDRGERVADYARKQSGISWPIPIDVKLDELLQLAKRGGDRATRRDIVAALIYHANFQSPGELARLLLDYRSATVGDLFAEDELGKVLEYRPSQPGPRSGKQ